MRVIAGAARGRTLLAPKGMSTRPMMDIVKGSLFNMLEAMGGIEGPALDLFSGTGSLGIEALSRGVAEVDFVESDREACKVIRANLERLGLAEQGRVITGSVDRFVGSAAAKRVNHAPRPYRLVFIDAPYAQKASRRLLETIVQSALLDAGGLICVGHHRHEDLPDELGVLERVKFRCFGASCISIYRRAAAGQQN
jgi:16S rRNA (guanine966-N2)-methyltransferase